MDELVLVEGEKSQLFEHLNTTFPLSSLSAVASLAPAFCRLLCEQVQDRLLAHASQIFPGSVARPAINRDIEFDGRSFRIQFTTEPLTDRDKLPFAVLEHGGDPLPLSETTKPTVIALSSISQYSAIEFSIAPKLPVNENLLDSLVRGMFSTGFQWFSNKITAAIRSDTARISTSLYDYMRSMLAERLSILDGFVLSCLLDRKDFVILDDLVAEGALRLASERAARYQKSREAIVLQMIGEVVNIEDSVITDACNSDSSTMKIPLTNESKYYRENEDFFDSLAAVWGKEVTCHPIVRSGRLRVVAFYPSAVAYELTPLVQVHVATLGRMASEQTERISEHLKILESVFSPRETPARESHGGWVKISEILGTLGGSFSGHLIKHSAN